jgi:hypothetical protein
MEEYIFEYNNNNNRTSLLLDNEISLGRGVIKKETDYILQHIYITIEIQHMFNAKTKVIPVVTGSKWNHLTITQYLSNILGKHEIKQL